MCNSNIIVIVIMCNSNYVNNHNVNSDNNSNSVNSHNVH